MHKIAIRLGISVAIAAVIVLWLMGQGFDVLPSWESIQRHTVWWALPTYVLLFTAFHLLRAWRWIYLLRPFSKIDIGTTMETAFVGFLAIQMMPLRTGEVARPYLLDRYTGVSKSALFGTIAIERVVDGLLVSLWLSAVLFGVSASRGTHIWLLRLVPLGIFLSASILLVAFYHRPREVRMFISSWLGLLSKRVAEFTAGVVERFHKGLAALPNRRCLWSFIGLSILYWSINALSWYLLAKGCGISLPLLGAVAGMGCLAVGILLPTGPGYFGNFQVSVLIALKIYLPIEAIAEQAAVFVFLLYALQTGLTVLFGACGALSLSRRAIYEKAREPV